MPQPTFMKISARYIPQDIYSTYNITSKIKNGLVYCKIKKGMYNLKQAALLAYKFLKQNLEPHGCIPIPHTVGLWKHKSRNVVFCLCVDDFGVKYYDKKDVHHLIQTLQNFMKYPLTGLVHIIVASC